MCKASELELILCGQNTSEYNFKELEKVTLYDDGYHKDHPVIRWFWSFVSALSLESRKKLLVFVTASDRIPLNGLQSLSFIIQRNGPSSDRLPTALTCFGRLLLPEYDNELLLRDRVMTAIENAAGFGLV